MVRIIKLTGILMTLSALAAGCAQVPKEAGFGDVQQLVGQRVDYRVYWNQGTAADLQVEQAVDTLLEDELSVDDAVQIALLNNPSLQATYENLGITQADVVEAGLLENPVIIGAARFPDRAPSGTNLGFDIVQNFLSVLMRPARKELATLQFEQAKMRVTHEILKTAADVQKTYYEALGAKQVMQLRKQIAEAAEASYEMARRLHAAGNISELNLTAERGQYEQAKVALAESDVDLFSTREQLTRLMGLWGQRTSWRLPDRLPMVPADEIALEYLESQAISNRMDLAAARQEAEVIAQALGITLDWRWLGSAEVGISSERDTDGQWVVGPSLAIELPIFNQRQTDIARLEAQLRQSHKKMASLAVEIRSDVRALRHRLIMTRNLVEHYKNVLLPLRERIVDLTLKEYNYMLAGVFDLLLAKQKEFENYQKYIEAVRDYWVIRSELQWAVGGRLLRSSQKGDDIGAAGDASHLSTKRPHGTTGTALDVANIKTPSGDDNIIEE